MLKPSELFVAALGSWIDFFIRRSMQDFFLYSRQHGLSMTQIGALFMLRRKGTSSVSEIGEELEITNPAASQLLERLVQQGLVGRSEDPNDRRLKQIVLTKHGQALLQHGLHAREKWLDDLSEIMPPAEQEQVIAALHLLLERAHQLEWEATPEA